MTYLLPSQAFVGTVMTYPGMPDLATVQQAVRIVLDGLARDLPDGWADLLAAELPCELGDVLRAGTGPPGAAAHPIPAHAARLAAALPVSEGSAVALTEAVLGVLARTVDRRLLLRVASCLPDDVRHRLTAPPRLPFATAGSVNSGRDR